MSLASVRRVSGVDWVQSDVGYQYNTDEHSGWLAGFVAPNLACWAFLFPGGFLLAITLSRHKLDLVKYRMRWGFFYNEYTKGAFFWEFVKIFQKEFIIIFLTYYED